MALKNLFDMAKADRYTADGREELIKAQKEETEDVKYQNGDISQKTGLMKTPNGWVEPPKGKQSAGTRHAEKRKTNRPKAIRWDRNNLNEMRGNEEYINAKAADNYYHQYGLDKIGEYKDSKGWTVKEYQNDDGETYRAMYNGEKYVGSEYDPSGEIRSPEEKPAAAAGPTDEELEIFKDIVREFKKSPNKKNEQIMNEAKSHLMKNRGMTPEQLGKLGREVYAEKTADAAPRQLTGDTRIKVRK